MNFWNLNIGANNFLLAFATATGIFSFFGLKAGSPVQIFKSETTELFFSKAEKSIRTFVFTKVKKKTATVFLRNKNFKHLTFQQNRIDKIAFIHFFKKDIPSQFSIKIRLFLYFSESLEDSTFASLQG